MQFVTSYKFILILSIYKWFVQAHHCTNSPPLPSNTPTKQHHRATCSTLLTCRCYWVVATWGEDDMSPFVCWALPFGQVVELWEGGGGAIWALPPGWGPTVRFWLFDSLCLYSIVGWPIEYDLALSMYCARSPPDTSGIRARWSFWG